VITSLLCSASVLALATAPSALPQSQLSLDQPVRAIELTVQLTDGSNPVTDAQVLVSGGQSAQTEAATLPGGRYYFNDVAVKEVVTIGFPQRDVLPISLEFMFENTSAVWITVVLNPATGEIKDIETKITERKPGEFTEVRGNRRQGLGNTGLPEGGGGPANDLCAGALPIFDGATAYSTVGAGTDGVGDVSCMFDGQTYHDIWYSYEASCTGDLTVSTCSAADYDTDLVIYDGGCGSALLDCNDDFGPACLDFSSEMTVPVVAGNTYTIRVGGWNDGDFGTGTLTLTCEADGPGGGGEASDECEDAGLIPCNSENDADNSTATTNVTDPGFSCHFSGPGTQGVNSVWFKFVATDTSAFLDTNASVAPADDSLIAVYDGECGSLVEIACSEDEGVGLLSEVCAEGLTIGNT